MEHVSCIILITTSRAGAGLWCFRHEQDHTWSAAKKRHSCSNPVKVHLVKVYQATHMYVANKVTIKENRWRFINSIFAVLSKFPNKGRGLVKLSLQTETADFPPPKWLDEQARMIAFCVLTHQRAAAFQMWCQPIKTQDVPLALQSPSVRPSSYCTLMSSIPFCTLGWQGKHHNHCSGIMASQVRYMTCG